MAVHHRLVSMLMAVSAVAIMAMVMVDIVLVSMRVCRPFVPMHMSVTFGH